MALVVSSISELYSALNNLSPEGGQTIILLDGEYGSLALQGFDFGNQVEIVSEVPGGALFDSISISQTSNVSIQSVHVESPTNGSSASKLININESDYIEIIGSEINGPIDDVYDGHFGVSVTDSTNILVQDNDIHDVKRAGVFSYSDDIIVSGNVVDYIGDDSFKFLNINNALIENNFGAGHIYPEEGAHLDFIQFQGASSNIVVSGNVLLPQTESAASVQGIFFDDAPYDNILIENNIIVTGMIRGISVSDGTNVEIRNNTVLDLDGMVHKATHIIAPGANQYGNIIGTYLGDEGLTSDLRIQQNDPQTDHHYDDYFANADFGLGMKISDLALIEGSLAESYGAFERLRQLLEVEGDASPEEDQPIEDIETVDDEDEGPKTSEIDPSGRGAPPKAITLAESNDNFFDFILEFFKALFGGSDDKPTSEVFSHLADNEASEALFLDFSMESEEANFSYDGEDEDHELEDWLLVS